MMMNVLAHNWWAFVGRGILAILFGVLVFLAPGVTMLSLVLLFAAYALVDGVLDIAGAITAARAGERWGLLVLEGVVDIAAAAFAVMWPHLTVVVFVLLLAGWAILTGALMFVASFKVEANHGRWWMMLGGVVSLLYGAVLIVAPMIGALVLTWWIGAYALAFGVSMLVLAYRLRARLPGHPTGMVHT